MSGSPVFVPHRAFIDPPGAIAARERVDADASRWLDELEWLGIGRGLQTVGLERIGNYAGATGDRTLDRLQLDRMYGASAMDEAVRDRAAEKSRNRPTNDFG